MVAFWRGSQVHLSWSKCAVEGTASLGVRLTEFGVLENHMILITINLVPKENGHLEGISIYN